MQSAGDRIHAVATARANGASGGGAAGIASWNDTGS